MQNITGEIDDEPTIKVSNDKNDSVNLSEIIKMLEERLSMYKLAETIAKSKNDFSKARRYNRGFKTLEQLLNSCRQGKKIDQSEIPPVLPASATSKDEKTNSGMFFFFFI